MKRTHATIVAVLIALALLAGCGDKGDTAASTPPTTQPTQARTSRPTQGPTSVISSVGTASALERALLAPEADFPGGWHVSRVDGAREREEHSSLCNTQFSYKSLNSYHVEYSRNPGEPLVGHIITQYVPGDAKRALDDIQNVVQTCSEWQVQGTDGKSYTSRISRLQMPNLGDQSASFVVESGTPTGEVQSAIVLIRRGDVTSGLIFSEQRRTSVDSPMIERLARRADQKLAAALR
jgi:predicted small lipoprotein YifL